jgi:hypothetical protein
MQFNPKYHAHKWVYPFQLAGLMRPEPAQVLTALRMGDWAVLSATVERLGPFNCEANVERQQDLECALNAADLLFLPCFGVYKQVNQGPSCLILNIRETGAIALAKWFEQESVLVLAGLLFTDHSIQKTRSDNKGSPGIIVGPDARNWPGYTTLPNQIDFAFNLADARENHLPHEN